MTRRDAVAALAGSGLLYGPARRLEPRPEGVREAVWLARAQARDRWVPLMAGETRPMLAAYDRAQKATAQVRATFLRREVTVASRRAGRVMPPSAAQIAARSVPQSGPQRVVPTRASSSDRHGRPVRARPPGRSV